MRVPRGDAGGAAAVATIAVGAGVQRWGVAGGGAPPGQAETRTPTRSPNSASASATQIFIGPSTRTAVRAVFHPWV